ncbi:MAG: DUF3137 domain-containing protein [Coprococcus sp.]
MMTTEMMTTEQIESKLKFMRIKVTIYRILTYGPGAATILSLVITENFLIFWSFLVTALVFVIPTNRTIKKIDEMKKLLGERVINSVIRDVLGYDVEYNPVGVLNPGSVVVPFHYKSSDGDHHIKTVYNGVKIELGNVILYDKCRYYEGEFSSTVYSTVVQFRGPWLICDFGKKPACNVYISERTNKGRKFMKSNVKIDNEKFNSRFCVRADFPQEAYQILTPQMMESISAVADKSGGTVYMSFLTNGKMHVAIQSRHNLFELGICYNAERMRQKFLEELRRLTDIINTLNVWERNV